MKIQQSTVPVSERFTGYVRRIHNVFNPSSKSIMVLQLICALTLLMHIYYLVIPSQAKTCQSIWSDKFVFVNANSSCWHDGDKSIWRKEWTQSEKELVCQLFRTVQIKYPKLYYRACKVYNVGLRRAQYDTVQSDSCIPDPSLAVTTTDATMVFCDSFFHTDRRFQLETILHELVHVIDMGNIISTNKEWIQLLGPNISAVRSYWRNSISPSDPHTERRLQNVAHKLGLLDGYCAADLNEALAIYTTDYLLKQGRGIKNPEIIAFIKQQVLSSSPNIDRFRKLYLEATNATYDGNYNEAFRCLNELSRDYPDATEVHASRANLWGFKHDFEMMHYEAEQELELLNRRQIPKYHHTYTRAHGLLEDANLHRGY